MRLLWAEEDSTSFCKRHESLRRRGKSCHRGPIYYERIPLECSMVNLALARAKNPAWLAERTGFERMVVDVCLGEVGPVAAREVLRFARNSNDLQQPISHVGGLLSIINATLAVQRGVMRVQRCDELWVRSILGPCGSDALGFAHACKSSKTISRTAIVMLCSRVGARLVFAAAWLLFIAQGQAHHHRDW